MKKLFILISLFIVAFIIFLIFLLTPKEYKKEYTVEDFKIFESYFKEEKYYQFQITKDDYKFEFIEEHKYINARKLIKKIQIIEKDNLYCILATTKDIPTYPMCYENNILTNYSLIDDEDLSNLYQPKNNIIEKTYNNIKIHNYFNNTYLLWNYKGLYYLNEDTQKEINLLENDVYNIDLIASVNNYLFIPDYDQEHKFKSAYLIDIKSGESDIWYLDYEIYFDSFIMGSIDKSIYLFDKKNNIQYELVPHKKRMRKLSKNDLGKVWNKDKFEDISLSKINKNELKFTYKEKYQFYLENNILLMNITDSNLSTKISNIENPQLIYQNNNEIYYLKNDKLYGYNPYQGEQLLIEYFEWKFNNTNMIFIY